MNRLKDPKIIAIALLSLVLLVLLIVFVAGKPGKNTGNPPATTVPPTTEPIVVDPLERQEKLVGICLPDKSTWGVAGDRLNAELVNLGYKTKLLYGDGTAKKQNSQMLELVNLNVDCIVIAPVDSVPMAEAAKAALSKKIPVLSYGSLLMDTEAAVGYVCYDYEAMGAEVATYVATQLKLDTAKAENRVHSVELFMGSPENYNAVQFYNGVMSVLDGYRSAGVLEIKSLRTTFEICSIEGWSKENAKVECANRLKNHYKGEAVPDACICASDNIAAGVIEALDEREKTSLVTGNGNTAAGQRNIAAGKQALTVNSTIDEPAIACAAMVDWAIFGAMPQVKLGRVSNNAVTIPAALCSFTLVKKE